MGYYTENELKKMGFKSIGKNVKISTKASIYYPDKMELGDNFRVDDFCVISGKLVIGNYCNLATHSMLLGSEAGIYMDDFSGCGFGAKVFAHSDDFLGFKLGHPEMIREYKDPLATKPIVIEKFCSIGTNSVIMPTVTLKEGTSVGALTVIRRSTKAWSIYLGNPAKKIGDKEKNMIHLSNELK